MKIQELLSIYVNLNNYYQTGYGEEVVVFLSL